MTKNPAPPRLPPLSLEALNRVEQIERHISAAVGLCNDPASLRANEQRANRILRTYAVELLDAQFGYYDALPGYHSGWDAEIAKITLEDMLRSFPLFMSSEPYRPELVRTINDYIEARFERPKVEPEEPKQASRKELREAYLAAFPEVKILDICWAADQRYREWKRWLKNEVKDGSMPDLAFRRVLMSGKRPQELKTRPRPAGWQ